MTTKFFTNDGDNTLLRKLEGIFQYMDIHYFDAIIGYFRASGYFRIYGYVRDVEQMRFLVGINIDDLTYRAVSKGLEFRANKETTVDHYTRRLIKDIQEAEYDKTTEDGMVQFIDDVVSGKVQIKAHPSKSLHAKVYIFRQQHYHPHASYGAVITGSSNLTEAGLEKNFEFNVELRDHDDILFASETFEKLWEEAVPVSPEAVEGIRKKTYLNPDFTPFEIYIKFLAEYFGSSIEYDPENPRDIPDGYMHLQYQQEAVNDGMRRLRKHNGFFLADVVGLGKTIIACQIAKKFYNQNGTRTHILIVHPPALKPAWEKHVRDFNIANIVKFVSNGSLHKIKHPEDFDLIIVDEAHKFRSDTSDMFHHLQMLCKTPRRNPGPDGDKQKKVILISATPLNNKPEDIRNLILLFQDGRNSTIDGVHNIISFFRPLIDRYNRAKHLPLQQGKEEIKHIYASIRNKVLEPVIVRRTRTDIMNSEPYKKDIEKQGIRFPKVEKPRPLYYILDNELNDLYVRTVNILKNKTELHYYRYQAISYLHEPFKAKYANADKISDQLAFIMKTLLVKRLDSSFHSFIISLEKYRKANRAMVQMFANNRVHIAPNLRVSEYIVNEKEEDLIKLMEDLRDTDPSVETYNRDAFETGFCDGLIKDQEILDALATEWEQWQAHNKDPKLKELLEKLNGELLHPDHNKTNKLVIFSEYKDTTDYLKQNLKKEGHDRLLTVDSHNVNELLSKIEANFDERAEPGKRADEYDIIITTEVLAEGVNLHRSHIILNYDIPWNATRLMQRIGRVNRIGTRADKILIYNFYPTEQTEKDISLKKKAILKLQSFHSALGEDSQIYSSEEEYDTFGLFDKEPEEEKDERLEYLMKLRQFRQDNPDWFAAIHQMPKRSRTARQRKDRKTATVVYLKNTRRDSFYYIDKENSVEELTFLECARVFDAYQTEQAIKPMPGHHYAHVSRAIAAFEEVLLTERAAMSSATRFGPNEKKAISYLSLFVRDKSLSDECRELASLAIEGIEQGKFQKLPRDVNNLQKLTAKADLKPYVIAEKLLEILKKYPLQDSHSPTPEEVHDSEGRPDAATDNISKKPQDKPQIIITESFI